jgi:hypothetical protein
LQGNNIDETEEQPSIGIAAFLQKWESRNSTNCLQAWGADYFFMEYPGLRHCIQLLQKPHIPWRRFWLLYRIDGR